MFNTVVRAAGVAILGGVGLFAAYSWNSRGSTDTADAGEQVGEPASAITDAGASETDLPIALAPDTSDAGTAPAAQAIASGTDSSAAEGRDGLRGLPAENAAPAPNAAAAPAPTAAATTPAANATSAAPRTLPTIGGPKAAGGNGVVKARNAVASDGKPAAGYFVANRRRIDKKDDGAYFTENTPTRQFGPCEKSDGTAYIGPGTAVNPFGDSDPCLPKATAQAFDVAAPVPLATSTSTAPRGPFGLPPQFGSYTPAPPTGGNFGSDYKRV